MNVCEMFFVGFGPGLYSMSPARSWRSTSQLGNRPPEWQDMWIQFAQSLLTVTHQPRAGCIRSVH